ncbi:MAG: hypothetical protein IIW79_00585 [Clostridia bacterium]|nr:hypothetical protein [Clostridia bacterium]
MKFSSPIKTLATPPENIRKELSFCCYPHKLTTASVLLLPLYRANAVTAISLPKQQKKAAFNAVPYKKGGIYCRPVQKSGI